MRLTNFENVLHREQHSTQNGRFLKVLREKDNKLDTFYPKKLIDSCYNFLDKDLTRSSDELHFNSMTVKLNGIDSIQSSIQQKSMDSAEGRLTF